MALNINFVRFLLVVTHLHPLISQKPSRLLWVQLERPVYRR